MLVVVPTAASATTWKRSGEFYKGVDYAYNFHNTPSESKVFAKMTHTDGGNAKGAKGNAGTWLARKWGITWKTVCSNNKTNMAYQQYVRCDSNESGNRNAPFDVHGKWNTLTGGWKSVKAKLD